jgi:hypothetical protein
VLLVHLAADALTQERRDDEPRFCGTAESLAMEMIANNLFNDRDDNGDLLGRYRLLWVHYGSRLKRFTPRRPPAEMLLEATGISFDDLTALGFAYWAHIRSCRWTQAYSEMIETRVEDQLRQMAPQLIGGQRAFFTEEDLQAAFPGDRNIDAGADFGGDVVLAEVVAGTVKLATREQADVTSFREDAERIVLGKARQLYVSAADLLRDPQPANSPLPVPAVRILPVVVCGGQFPVNPLTTGYIREQLAAEGLPPRGHIDPLILLDLEELEGCQALHQRRGTTLVELLDAWRRSQYGGVAFRNYLAYEYGGQEIGRPGDVQAALAESFEIIQQRLGAAGTWSPRGELDASSSPAPTA